MAKGDLAKAVAEAVTESQEGSAGEANDEGTGAPEATSQAEAAAATPKQDGNEVATSTEREDYDAFKAQYGVDLSVLPDDDSRDKFITEFRETNKTINQLQRKNAELEKAQEAPPAPPQPEPVEEAPAEFTDAQIAGALGIDIENADDRDMREIGLTRTLLETQATVEKLQKGFTETSQRATWTEQLSDLQGQFGPLPEGVSVKDVIAFAGDQGIASPEAAYWAAVGPVRAAVSARLNEQLVQLRTSTKKAGTTIRPGAAAETEGKLQATNVKDAIKEAFEGARARMGVEYSE